MAEKVLVTDTLFVYDEHEEQIRNAGYEILRIPKAHISTQELKDAMPGVVGYILGGVESVTEEVIDAAPDLRSIVLMGSGYKKFIPGWKHAQDKGILIGNSPDTHTHAVAEWYMAGALAANRGLFSSETPPQTPGIEGKSVGIIGLGRIGTKLAGMLAVFEPSQISYYSAHRHPESEERLRVVYAEQERLLAESDIVFLTVSGDVTPGFFGEQQIATMKRGALLVSAMIPGVIDTDALYDSLKQGKIRAVSDYPMDDRFKDLPAERWWSNKYSNAFSTDAGLRQTSTAAVRTLLNLLQTGDDPYLCRD